MAPAGKMLRRQRLRGPVLLFLAASLSFLCGAKLGPVVSTKIVSGVSGGSRACATDVTAKAVTRTGSDTSKVDAMPSKPSVQTGAAGDGLKLQIQYWLAFAAADAAALGTQLSLECEAGLGAPFLQRMTDSRGTLCAASSSSSGISSSHHNHTSSVECYAYPVRQKGLACFSRNLVLDAGAFMGSSVPVGHQEHHKYMPQGSPGSVQLSCKLLRQLSDSVGVPGSVWASDAGKNLEAEQLAWFKSAAADAAPDVVSAACGDGAAHVVPHLVMFVARLDPTNPYHHTQSMVQAFLSLAAVGLNSSAASKGMPAYRELQIMITDHFVPGPFMDVWRRLSAPHPVLSLQDKSLAGHATCFRTSVQAHYVDPSGAFLGYEGIGVEKTCPSSLMLAFAHWQRYLFLEALPPPEQAELFNPAALAAVGMPQATAMPPLPAVVATARPAGGAAGHRRVNVVWLSRAWFGRTMAAGGGLNSWQQSRQPSHDTESQVVHTLQQAVLDWNSRACAPPVFGWWQTPHAVAPQTGCTATNVTFDFHFVELSVEDLFPNQVVLLTRTAVLVGMHGAALTNQVWMRPHKGAVVEIWQGGNFHYRNMAHMLGHRHWQVQGYDPTILRESVTAAMDHVASKY